jgi:hypothetical protein
MTSASIFGNQRRFATGSLQRDLLSSISFTRSIILSTLSNRLTSFDLRDSGVKTALDFVQDYLKARISILKSQKASNTSYFICSNY